MSKPLDKTFHRGLESLDKKRFAKRYPDVVAHKVPTQKIFNVQVFRFCMDFACS